jgi:hypothetical protein
VKGRHIDCLPVPWRDSCPQRKGWSEDGKVIIIKKKLSSCADLEKGNLEWMNHKNEVIIF